MKIIFIITLTTLYLSNCHSQENDEIKYQFAKEVFYSNVYKPSNYPRFQKSIKKTTKDTYVFGDKKLKIEIDDQHFEKLFTLGIFNPDVIFGIETSAKTQTEIDSLPILDRVFYQITRNDHLHICCFEELKKLNTDPKIKRFKFWVLRLDTPNPIEYYIEFYNEKATKQTSIETFINEAMMTFYYEGSIVL